jgi:hypothetical protein
MDHLESSRLQEISDNLHVSRSLLQEWRLGGIVELVVLNPWNAVEEGLDDPIFRNVICTSVDHQGRDIDLGKSINYRPRCERTAPARSQI